MDDYHIRKLSDDTWIVSCMEQGKDGSPGKQIEYSYDSLDDALEDIKSGFTDGAEPEEVPEENPVEAKAKSNVSKIIKAEEE